MRHGSRIALSLLLAVSLAGAAAATSPTSARAEPSSGDDGGRPGPSGGRRHLHEMLERFADRLSLAGPQLAEIRKIADAARDEGQPLRERVRSLRDELHRALEQNAPDEASVMRLADQLGAAETAARKHRLQTMLRIRALLSPDQRRELVQVFEERKERRRQMRRAAPDEDDDGGPSDPPPSTRGQP